jgi:16S rRNA (cytosine1402-N4)-methyltransferase
MNVHIPVLLNPILEVYKDLQLSGPVFDGTYGGGSYSLEFNKLNAKVFGCDLDPNAIKREQKNPNLTLVQSNFADYIMTFPDNFFDLIVVDLGFSNNQLVLDNKGFSHMKADQILDLRYNENEGQSASELLKHIKYDELSRILYENSGETFSRKIATTVIDNRDSVDVITVEIMEKWVSSSIPMKFKNKRVQVLSRVWQALRIYINYEFESLKTFLDKAPSKLKVGGVLCVVNFHSLEDKITTNKFRDLAKTYDVDNYGNKGQDFELLTRKAITPDDQELTENNQSRSATLRIIKRCQGRNK